MFNGCWWCRKPGPLHTVIEQAGDPEPQKTLAMAARFPRS